jgi:hypothetical protein
MVKKIVRSVLVTDMMSVVSNQPRSQSTMYAASSNLKFVELQSIGKALAGDAQKKTSAASAAVDMTFISALFKGRCGLIPQYAFGPTVTYGCSVAPPPTMAIVVSAVNPTSDILP